MANRIRLQTTYLRTDKFLRYLKLIFLGVIVGTIISGCILSSRQEDLRELERVTEASTNINNREDLIRKLGTPDNILNPNDFSTCTETKPSDKKPRHCTPGIRNYLATNSLESLSVWIYYQTGIKDRIFAFPINHYFREETKVLYVLIDNQTGLIKGSYLYKKKGDWE